MGSLCTQTARELRRRSTPAERYLWERLRGYRLGGHYFRRQYPIDRFIVDFVCCKARLVIEVDGGHHQGQLADDAERTVCLESCGYTVLRFTNTEVFARMDEVLARIREYLGPHPCPSPEGRGVGGKTVD